MSPSELVAALAEAYEEQADESKAAHMAAYMRDQFDFHGIQAKTRRLLDREVVSRGPARPAHHYQIKVAHQCWERPQREFQYFAVDYLRTHYRRLDPPFIELGREFVVTKSWWDTVDALAGGAIGPFLCERGRMDVMDQWILSDNIWVARAALLSQLMAKDDTDAERLFTYCAQRASDTDFFIRKAIGWALRQYARTDPLAVRKFVAAHADQLSPMSQREALKHLGEG